MIGQRKKVWFCLMAITVLLASAVVAFAGKSLEAFAQSPSVPTISDLTVPANGWGFPAPWGTAFDSSGRLWVALPGCDPGPKCSSTFPGKIAVYNPKSGTWPLAYQLPAHFAQPLFLAFDKQGRVWFPEPMNNSLGMLDPRTNKFSQWAVPTSSAGPWDVAVDQSGKVWFTEHYGNKIGYFDPATKKFKEIATPGLNTVPYGITVDSSNNVWFTENNAAVAQIAEYTAQGKLREYKIRSRGSTSGLTPHLITTDGHGYVWWSEGWVGMIGKLKIASAVPGTNRGVIEYSYRPPCASCSKHTSGIAIDANGNIWFTDAIQSILGSFNTSSSAFSLFKTPSSASHPHDGLNAGPNRTVWFTEEFADKLGRVVLR